MLRELGNDEPRLVHARATELMASAVGGLGTCCIASGIALAILLTDQESPAAVRSGSCARVYGEYVDAVRSAPIADDQTRHQWIARFESALAQPRSPDDIDVRLAVLGELGSLQRSVGDADLARENFARMGREAEQAGRYSVRVDAIETELGMIENSDDLVERADVASELEYAIEDYMEQLGATDADLQEWGRVSDSLLALSQARARVAAELQVNGLRTGDEASRRAASEIFDGAEDAAAMAVSLGEVGLNEMPHKLYQLAQIRSARGDAEGASAAYRELLRLDDGTYSRMWISDLELRARYRPDSPEYRSGAERILAQHVDDPYEVRLRHGLSASYMQSGSFPEAIATLAGALGKGGDDEVESMTMWLLAQAYLSDGAEVAAYEILSDLVLRFPGTVSAVQALKDLETIGVPDAATGTGTVVDLSRSSRDGRVSEPAVASGQAGRMQPTPTPRAVGRAHLAVLAGVAGGVVCWWGAVRRRRSQRGT